MSKLVESCIPKSTSNPCSCPADGSQRVGPGTSSAPSLQACPVSGSTVGNPFAPASGLCARGLGTCTTWRRHD
eukprot:3935323-Rhodomonas_salina.1